MKIEITKGLRFSPNGRTVLSLDKDDIFEVGENGLTKDNLARLVELEVARALDVSDVAETPVEVIGNKPVETTTGTYYDSDGVADFTKITDKDELDLFALENHGVELDKRKSLKKMIAELKDAIAIQGDE